MPYLQAYLDTGKVERLMEMGTYGVGHWGSIEAGEQHRDNLTRALLQRFGAGRIGIGVATTLHYKQNVSTLADLFRTLKPFVPGGGVEVDIYYLQGADPDPVRGGLFSPPSGWWPTIKHFKEHGRNAAGGALKTDDDRTNRENRAAVR